MARRASEAAISPTLDVQLSRADIADMNEDQHTASNMAKLEARGGVEGVARLLGSDTHRGLSPADIHARRAAFGENRFPPPPLKGWWALFIGTIIGDLMLLVLIACAIVSLAVGIIEDPAKGWIEGMAVVIAIVAVAAVTATNDYTKERQFRKLYQSAEDTEVPVVREGKEMLVSVHDVVVGDLVRLDAGDKVPADGLLVEMASRIECDESSMTGEANLVKKSFEKDSYVLSGTNVAKGAGRMLVLAVGWESRWGRIKNSLTSKPEDTPLQQKLSTLAKLIGYLGSVAAALTIVAMFIIYFVKCPDPCPSGQLQCPSGTCVSTVSDCDRCPFNATANPNATALFMCYSVNVRTASAEECVADIADCYDKPFNDDLTPCNRHQHGSSFDVLDFASYMVEALMIAITIVVVAVPEGLPLAVTISLSFSTKKMLRDNNLIRVLAACETMGNATNICSDKTGTLTENQMRVVHAWIAGTEYPLGHRFAEADVSDAAVRILLVDNCVLNSTCTVRLDPNDRERVVSVVGSRTEMALCLLSESLGTPHEEHRRVAREDENRIAMQWLFTSERKMMSTLVDMPDAQRLYVKGASEIVLDRCTHVSGVDGTSVEPLTEERKGEIVTLIQGMASQALRTLCLAHKDMPPETETPLSPDDDPPEFDLVLDAVVGIQDRVRREVPDAVRSCDAAGIVVRMVTGDNIDTAVAIAKNCGIARAGDVAMEGPDFRNLTPAQLDALLPRLRVLARSAPSDKLLMVQRLNGAGLPTSAAAWAEMHPDDSFDQDADSRLPGYAEEWRAAHKAGEVVGVTGDGTNDAPALKSADVGLAMGIAGTDVAKSASDIVILDDNFSSIVKAVKWGRSIYDNIRKFLQFQLNVNVVALAITFIGAVSGFDPPLNPVMMLWVNLIMDTMGALALATEPPTDDLLERRPYKRSAALLSRTMWRNIAVQSTYQLVLLLVLLYAGASAFNLDVTGRNSCIHRDYSSPAACEESDYTHYTIMFNAFVFCQVFNEINSRRLNNELNQFSGLHKNGYFVAVIFITSFLQFLIVTFGGDFTRTTPLSWENWLITVALGAVSLPLGNLQRLIPVNENQASFAPDPDAGLVQCDAALPGLAEDGVRFRIIQ